MIGAVTNYPDNVTGNEPELTGEWPCPECCRPMRATCGSCGEATCANPACPGCECEADDEDDQETFAMTVRMGNAAMQEGEDLVRPLRHVSDRLVRGERSGVVHDENGNAVGAWSLKTMPRIVQHCDRPIR